MNAPPAELVLVTINEDTHTRTDLHLEEDQLWFVASLLFSLSHHCAVPVATSLDDLLRICMTSPNHQVYANIS